MIAGRPDTSEAAPYYFTYINRISTDDIVGLLGTQLEETLGLLAGISEERSLYRYAPGKWSIREALNHVNDTERVFLFRAFWFGRGFEGPQPSFDQDMSATAAKADLVCWASHIDEFRAVRLATLTFFRSLPEEGWMRSGIASEKPVTVRALAYIIAGHAAHHVAIHNQRYS